MKYIKNIDNFNFISESILDMKFKIDFGELYNYMIINKNYVSDENKRSVIESNYKVDNDSSSYRTSNYDDNFKSTISSTITRCMASSERAVCEIRNIQIQEKRCQSKRSCSL